ncbi:tetratricopeptide repeat protein [Nonomuraea sp. NPDC050663]|uniref:tetratricopeptide repeat protein n=1 Tax=Nonomuraea sp. NPDC050663 TaxID=3364370 RepID=UPI0037A0527F
MTPPELDTSPLDTARRLAENGDLEGAAEIFGRLAGDDSAPERAQAAVGLAVVLEEQGDHPGARRAARIALSAGPTEYSAQAACLLAQSFEREGSAEQARGAWQAVLGVGHDDYVPLAHMALARLAAEENDLDGAETQLRAALEAGGPMTAAQRLADLLLERGEPGEAADLIEAALERADDDTAARLRVQLGIAHLELACAQFAAAAEDGRDRETVSLAIELLARTLPLRGRPEQAEQVWSYGLDHDDEELAEQVRLRRERG